MGFAKMASLGIYIHIPYCHSICSYCNFFREKSGLVPEDYLDFLIKEASSYLESELIHPDTIYIGGGTPSLLNGNQVKRLMTGFSKIFNISDIEEFTIEANPESINKNLCREFIDNGINRISIGVQSLFDPELQTLGRLADRETCLNAVKIAMDAGFENISVDIMGGIPLQNKNSLKKTLEEVILLGVKHISFYLLERHSGTSLSTKLEKGEIKGMNEDEESELYLLAVDSLEKRGFRQYEISNFALPGFECLHNLLYWRINEYIGFGPSAHSHFRSWRYSNVADINEYKEILKGGQLPIGEREKMSDKRYIEDTLIFGLRLSDGINIYKLNEKYAFNIYGEREEKMRSLESAGYIELSENSIKLTRAGMVVSNEIINFLFNDLFKR